MNWLVLFLTQKKKKNMYKEQFISSIPDVTAANRFMIVTDTTISIWIGRNFKIYFLMFNHNAKLGK